MAEVYKVWDEQRQTYLAMKLLREDLAEDRIFLRRFRKEAQTLADLQHPNIVRYYGLEQRELSAFILMEYVEGITLRKEIFDRQEPASLRRVLDIMTPICSALHYAHQVGWVHCDIKPANIMIRKDGFIQLADFGIARMTESATTTTVAFAGTPAYMAPEQALGLNPTPQTDIYALGVILFELLTGGERPFTGERAATTGTTSEKVRWEQVHRNAPSPCIYNRNISDALEAVTLRCLQKRPEDRFQTPVEFLEALRAAIPAAAASMGAEFTSPTNLPMVVADAGPGAAAPGQSASLFSHFPAWLPAGLLGAGAVCVVMALSVFAYRGLQGTALLAFLNTATPTATPTSPATMTLSATITPVATGTLPATKTPTKLPTKTLLPPTETRVPTTPPKPTQTRPPQMIDVPIINQGCYPQNVYVDGKYFGSPDPWGKSINVHILEGRHQLKVCPYGSILSQCDHEYSVTWYGPATENLEPDSFCPNSPPRAVNITIVNSDCISHEVTVDYGKKLSLHAGETFTVAADPGWHTFRVCGPGGKKCISNKWPYFFSDRYTIGRSTGC